MRPPTPSISLDFTKTHGTLLFPKLPPPSPTQAHIDIIRYTWEHLCGIRLDHDDPTISPSHAFGLAFYNALFESDPTLRFLFTNIVQQARAFAGFISYLARMPTQSNIREMNALKRKGVGALTFPELVTEVSNTEHESATEDFRYQLQELGAKHYYYGVNAVHFDSIGRALMKALKERLRNEFLPEIEEAWTRSYAYSAYYMKIGLESAQDEWRQHRNESMQTKQNCTIQ
ncbi:hypothetical protein G6F70_007339 [Rhizopus microsporus]|uniref:Globin domain-containing protein n=1 Tax=Rhizopus microsporus TaxID=58291 RepID=A0A0A1NMH2_RHIZD|nr:hypothetical protein G6F71_002022 [Rhizopus microsporus]KAG1196577.1 hypothetical protein G6F70_007339 [Rhizopus microsporus]KAG1208304.1 hypothetical protein G6F69_007336 [Rhizopus microsporus]KAG1229662.1 hypothetical protein G6F67_006995 [Rhizopus microsporus]KAG1261649.1 hypothetical protein G6F68_006534 [Rhizopus microsporus]